LVLAAVCRVEALQAIQPYLLNKQEVLVAAVAFCLYLLIQLAVLVVVAAFCLYRVTQPEAQAEEEVASCSRLLLQPAAACAGV
jgi:hypothetical protein